MYEPIFVPRQAIEIDLAKVSPFAEPLPTELTVRAGRDYIGKFHDYLVEKFRGGISVASLLKYRTSFTDYLLTVLFKYFRLHDFEFLSLVAVGGYGRSELFLESDVDILVVSSIHPIPPDCQKAIEPFISFLWDLKLDVGSSVRSITEAVEASQQDLTIKTNLLETHMICGSTETYQELLAALEQDDYWDPKTFLKAKIKEQEIRQHNYKDTAYLLEPDIKNNAGGLRDIHIMQWIANFHFKARTIHDMLFLGFLNQAEFDELVVCRSMLWDMRYALHIAINKVDNRLTLDSQRTVARLLGYQGEGNAPVERMMRAFFRTVRRIRELNSVALQLETLRITGHLGDGDEPEFLNSYFVRRGTVIDIIDPDLFVYDKPKLLEIFYEISKHPGIRGLHVHCLRKLRDARRALTYYLVEIPECRATLKKILSDPRAVAISLPLMHEHRILSAYMPQWEHIEGQTQFDMFHAYSVDEHTIRVLKNITGMRQSDAPITSLFRNVYHQINDPALLSTAALLHDIAKGQGGPHAELGARIALYFCQLHGYSQYQSKLVCFLVRHHLLMSTTAQRRDIADPEIVNGFAKAVQDEEQLNLLYCLTVIDIAGTNDHEWTSWKEAMFRQLYFSARQALRHGLEMPQDLGLHAEENQQIALRQLKKLSEEKIKTLWASFNTTYFIRYTPFDIAWHTRNILTFPTGDQPLILFAQHEGVDTEVLIYTSRERFDFAKIAFAMALKHLNVQSAQIVRNKLNHSLCTIKFRTQSQHQLDNDRLHSLRRSIIAGLNEEPSLTRLASPKGKQVFRVPTQVNFLPRGAGSWTNLEISSLDTPGLLAKIGIVLADCGCLIQSARITTTGERADDFFSIINREGQPLDSATQQQLSRALLEVLNPRQSTETGETNV